MPKLDDLLMENKRMIRIKTDAFPGQQDRIKVVDSHSQQLQVIQNEAIAEAVTTINSSSLKYEENSSTEATSLQMQEIEKLKVTVDSFNLVMREEETLSQVELDAMKGRMNLLCHELDSLRGKVEKQDSYISEKSREFDVIVSRLEQALQLVHRNETTLSELNEKLRTVLDSRKELEKQNRVLSAIIKEKEKASSSSISKEKEFMECIRRQSLRKKVLRYKEISETRGSNLQKAELEVDLLGDEVEVLTDLFAKIYTALDHYSPVLQHYTGVMETLNMIKKHISMSK
ncbi:hypothetical protein GUJ93_ZPchr0010g10772 [Zizania palustris]|uniref:Uncharacterized protein n=1 Tax=Zizania palustris TaxID=103762 RepID=A0A8J5WDW5_ZIZPA|nr:hypothetical protein GUJ93_ZPchr0010g10772 [Zizania palustris]